ncbi:DinB family protein [Bacillus sp. NEB1478]|uniref:DinB family protein n=1 Tax=Bacillus sp. NEB1478 TaxID=3073816 RepID=UPI002873A882|nr:DinB family protein [Bacillus sp. NEB1478]WNB93372.1 DinB family protein [Bacillus sp. NEB1478]
MNISELLNKELENVFDQEDWYPPLKDALEGLTVDEANWKPEGIAANSIWETASHLHYYKERLLNRLEGKTTTTNVQNNDETFVSGNDEKSWKEFHSKMEQVHRQLQKVVGELTENDLSHERNGTATAKMISSIILHDAYHTGQIIQIRKLQGSWVASRSF